MKDKDYEDSNKQKSLPWRPNSAKAESMPLSKKQIYKHYSHAFTPKKVGYVKVGYIHTRNLFTKIKIRCVFIAKIHARKSQI